MLKIRNVLQLFQDKQFTMENIKVRKMAINTRSKYVIEKMTLSIKEVGKIVSLRLKNGDQINDLK